MANIDLQKEEAIRFYNNLLDEENSRIIFSAPFGVGKTTFLKQISKPENNAKFCSQQKFNFFHIYPVNYSVASNEDIFQLIKYDLIYLLVEKGAKFQKEDFNFLGGLKKYLKSNAHKLAAKLFLFIPQVGKDLYEVFDQLNSIKDEFLAACEEGVIDEGEKFYEYLLDMQGKSGSVYEIDVYTKLLQKILQREKDEKKAQNVLIIDDLDRIDPHHIFRLLNVFSAHFDSDGFGNKFGFDKIVFVCDLNNIRKIFANIYGANVDFNGYIDKFYTKTVFKFFNDKVLIENLRERLSLSPAHELDLTDIDKKFIIDVLSTLLVNGKLNFRSIIKADALNNLKKLNSLYTETRSEFIYCKFLGVSIFLRDLFGNYESFHNIISEMNTIKDSKENRAIVREPADIYYYYNLYLGVVLNHRNHWWKYDQEFDVYLNTLIAKFRLKKSTGRASYYFLEPINNSIYPDAVNSFWLNFKKAIEILHENSLL